MTQSLRGPIAALHVEPATTRPREPPSAPPAEDFAALFGESRRSAPALQVLPHGEANWVAPIGRGEAPRLVVHHHGDQVTGWAVDAPPRLVHSLRRGRELPRRQLDLHRVRAVEARQRLSAFVTLSRCEGVRCVLVVCGRGLHSRGALPVLPDVTVRHLCDVLSAHMLAFCTAPRRFGGGGALLIRLRPPRSRIAPP